MHERLTVVGGSNNTNTSVHLGWLVSAERLVTVNRLHPQHVADELAIARVREEACIAMSIHHPNVISMLGLVRHPSELLAVLEYVPGASLAEIICEGVAPQGLEPQVASAIAASALRGLHAAHEMRNPSGTLRCISPVSPATVLVGEDGQTRVIDFDVPDTTYANASEGKLPYASPELLLRRSVDARRDVYSMSVVLWEALTGRRLFRGPTVQTMLRKILVEAVPAPSLFTPNVGPDLDAIVLRGLARDPADRFSSARAMAGALEQTPCASADDVARALAAMNLACVRTRRSLVDCITRASTD